MAEGRILRGRLKKGGIPFRLVSRIAYELGSVANRSSMQRHLNVSVPMLQGIAEQGRTPREWSQAIHSNGDPSKDSDKARAQFG